MPKLSIIVPTLDEGAVLGSFFGRLFKLKESKSAQIIVVDGGSSDNTRDVALHWMKKKRNIEWVEAPPGKGVAIRIGFGKAKSERIVFIDADLQYPPEEIARVSRALASSDLVLTKRKTSDVGHRRMLSLGFSQVLGKGMLNLPASDPQSGLKGMRASLLKKLNLTSRTWELDAELIKKAHEQGARIREIEIEFSPRAAGKSKTAVISTSANLFAGSMKLFFDGLKPRAG